MTFGRFRDLILIFLALLLAVYIATRSPTAPQLMLLILLYVITVNFSIPVSIGYVGLTPIVAISSLLTVGVTDALLAAGIGLPLAEMMRPFWQPLWQQTTPQLARWRDRIGLAILTLLSLALASLTFLRLYPDDQSVITTILTRIPNTTEATFEPILLTLFYFLIYNFLSLIYWRLLGSTIGRYFSQTGGYVAGTAFFAIPLTLFITSAEIGLPAFVLLCIGTAAFAIITWVNWQRRMVTVQRLKQFAALNTAGSSLRETLDLNEVLARIVKQVTALVSAEQFSIALYNSDSNVWEQPVVSNDGVMLSRFTPDDLTRWVVEHDAPLDLDPSNIHYAKQHKLQLPNPKPRVWLGVPLRSAGGEEEPRTIGALVLQKQQDGEPFSLWSRELLLAMAGQASAAIQNARLHSETLRLYNLTDAELARRVEQLQALLFSIIEGVLMLDQEGQIVLINPTAARLLEKSVGELRGAHLDSTTVTALGYQPEGLQRLLQRLASGNSAEFQEKTTPHQHTYQLIQNDHLRHIQRSERPVTSDEGHVMGWLMIFRDITEERERVEWRADLTRMIVHDLRNPITTLSSTVNLLENRLPNQDRVRVIDLLNTARHGAANMLEMVDSLMDINRAEVGKFIIDADAMRMNILLDHVLETIKPLSIQREINLSVESEHDLPIVWGDTEILRRVVVNLLDNALKFTPSGGAVMVTLAADDPFPNHESGVHVTIIDSGSGIPADQKQRIFDRFITFNRGGGQVRGTGLGLTFCKLAVEAHGGEIWVEDAWTGGSAFNFTIPGVPIF